MPRFQIFRLTGSDVVRWRLVGANNRVLALGPGAYAHAGAAAEEAALVAAFAATATPVLSALEEGRSWSWSVRDAAGLVLALAPRPYQRRVECRLSAERFITASATADVEHRLLVFVAGARPGRRGTPDPTAVRLPEGESVPTQRPAVRP